MYYETKQVLDLETGVLLQTEKKKERRRNHSATVFVKFERKRIHLDHCRLAEVSPCHLPDTHTP